MAWLGMRTPSFDLSLVIPTCAGMTAAAAGRMAVPNINT
jgi:hypothetical protein